MALNDELNDGTNDFQYSPDVLLHGVDSVLMVCDSWGLRGEVIEEVKGEVKRYAQDECEAGQLNYNSSLLIPNS